jgi:hypothetical protein
VRQGDRYSGVPVTLIDLAISNVAPWMLSGDLGFSTHNRDVAQSRAGRPDRNHRWYGTQRPSTPIPTRVISIGLRLVEMGESGRTEPYICR